MEEIMVGLFSGVDADGPLMMMMIAFKAVLLHIPLGHAAYMKEFNENITRFIDKINNRRKR